MGKLVDVSQHCGNLADKRDGSLMKALVGPIDNALVNRALNTPGIVIGTGSAAKVKFTNETICLVKGKLVTVAAATEVAFTATTDDIADGYCNVYLITVDSAGTAALVKGVPSSGSTLSNCLLPSVGDDKAVVGLVGVVTSGAIFDATTTLLSANTVTDTYYDIVGPFCNR